MSGYDISYFAESNIDLEDIVNAAIEVGYDSALSSTEASEMYVRFPDTSFTLCCPLDPDRMEVFSGNWDAEREWVELCCRYFSFECHKASFPYLQRLLRILLEKYGGVVCCDGDWKIVFTISSVDQFGC